MYHHVLGSSSLMRWAVTGFIGYLALVRCLRWRRYNTIHEKYASKIDTLTPQEAQEIVNLLFRWDMPSVAGISCCHALLKTFGIPSISRLLVKTGELNSLRNISKRHIDTGILVATWIYCPINGMSINGEDDPRSALAVARMNWLHSRYKISNKDFLYTLYVFASSPMLWAEKWGWRNFSSLEKRATYVFWSEIGRRMNIRDIPSSFDDLIQWAEAYENEMMVPAESNKVLADLTIDEFLYPIPASLGLKRLHRGVIATLLEDRLRNALMLPKQPWYVRVIGSTILSLVAFTQRHLLLPRWAPRTLVSLELPDLSKGRPVSLRPTLFPVRPWYKPESKGIRYLVDKLSVLFSIHAEMPGPCLESKGYTLQSLGPSRLGGAGHEAVNCEATRLHGRPLLEPWC